MTRALPELDLYQPYARTRLMKSLGTDVALKWGGDLAIGNEVAYVFAGLATERWQLLAPDMLRREVRLPGDPAKRPKWKTDLSIPRGTLLFGQPTSGAPFLYLGEMFPTSNSGSQSIGHLTAARWTDYRVKPRLPRRLWTRLRFRSVEVDGKIVHIDRWTGPHDSGRLFDILDGIRGSRRAVVRVYRRVGGTLTYTKQPAMRSLLLETGATRRRAILPYKSWPSGPAADEQTAIEALLIFWSYGIFLPSIRWQKGGEPLNA
jgi:hypothetical protein